MSLSKVCGTLPVQSGSTRTGSPLTGVWRNGNRVHQVVRGWKGV